MENKAGKKTFSKPRKAGILTGALICLLGISKVTYDSLHAGEKNPYKNMPAVVSYFDLGSRLPYELEIGAYDYYKKQKPWSIHPDSLVKRIETDVKKIGADKNSIKKYFDFSSKNACRVSLIDFGIIFSGFGIAAFSVYGTALTKKLKAKAKGKNELDK